MKTFILAAAFVSFVWADTSKWTQIRVKFAFSGILENVDAFWKVDNTLTQSLANKWEKVVNTNELGLTTTCVSQSDVRVCALYDSKGSIAGMQYAIPQTDVDNKGIPYNFNDFSTYEKKTINGGNYWTSTMYILNPSTLKAGGRDVVTTLGDGLWIKNGTSYVSIPTDEATISTKTRYTKQNCLPNMGTHYYDNVYKTTRCEDLEPFFLLTTAGNMNGIGWQFFGKTKFVDRNWYDNVNRQAAELTVPNGPKCMADWTVQYGIISVHTYFIEKPWEIKCDQAKDSVVPITGPMEIILCSLYRSADVAAWLKKLFMG